MTSYIAAELRRFVQSRANCLCEYCLIAEVVTYLGCQVDHIISEKHGGLTEAVNLSFACTCCNRAKGADIGSISQVDREFTRFFNPRHDHWADHFSLCGTAIESNTLIVEVTASILEFNAPERLAERDELASSRRYPPKASLKLLLRSLK